MLYFYEFIEIIIIIILIPLYSMDALNWSKVTVMIYNIFQINSVLLDFLFNSDDENSALLQL